MARKGLGLKRLRIDQVTKIDRKRTKDVSGITLIIRTRDEGSQ